jgi:hypothetical protein
LFEGIPKELSQIAETSQDFFYYALSKTANYLDKNHCFLSQKLKMNYFQFFASNFAKNEKVMAYCEPHSISVK